MVQVLLRKCKLLIIISSRILTPTVKLKVCLSGDYRHAKLCIADYNYASKVSSPALSLEGLESRLPALKCVCLVKIINHTDE